jgi:hypothetical protein
MWLVWSAEGLFYRSIKDYGLKLDRPSTVPERLKGLTKWGDPQVSGLKLVFEKTRNIKKTGVFRKTDAARQKFLDKMPRGITQGDVKGFIEDQEDNINLMGEVVRYLDKDINQNLAYFGERAVAALVSFVPIGIADGLRGISYIHESKNIDLDKHTVEIRSDSAISVLRSAEGYDYTELIGFIERYKSTESALIGEDANIAKLKSGINVVSASASLPSLLASGPSLGVASTAHIAAKTTAMGLVIVGGIAKKGILSRRSGKLDKKEMYKILEELYNDNAKIAVQLANLLLGQSQREFETYVKTGVLDKQNTPFSVSSTRPFHSDATFELNRSVGLFNRLEDFKGGGVVDKGIIQKVIYERAMLEKVQSGYSLLKGHLQRKKEVAFAKQDLALANNALEGALSAGEGARRAVETQRQGDQQPLPLPPPV